MQPDWKKAGRSTDPLARAQIEKEQNDEIQTEHSTYHGEATAHHCACIWWGAGCEPIHPPQDGFLSLDRSKFAASFAADVNPGLAAFMADSQVPWGVQALSGMVSEPAWKSKPSWYLVSTEDKMIPPDAQRAMSKRAGSKVVEVKGSHAIYVSQPRAVASLIEQAANGSVSTEK